MWPFGGKAKSPVEEAMDQINTAATEGGSSSGDGGKKKDAYSGSGFDPTGLERAAKAARELDRSTNGPRILELVREQEAAKAEEHRARAAEYEAYVKQQEVQRVKEEAEEARRTLQAQTEQSKRVADYQDQLERRRYIDKLSAERHTREREAARQEELVKRQEAIRRKTLEYEATLRQQTELARVQAETEGRIRQERENHDLRLEEARVSALEYRDTVLEGIKLAGETLGRGAREFLGDRERMAAAAATLTAVALGVYTAKVGTGVAGRYVEARLGKPSLVRDTSRQTLAQAMRHPLPAVKRLLGLAKPSSALQGVVLEPTLERRLQRVAQSTFNTKKNGAPFRHLLLYGPPGTGKTLFAKGLAKHSGLEYAVMTGGDIAPLGRDAVTELHMLFDWAQASRRGLLLFVDEADAFLRRRSTEHISEDLRNALNAFLYRTGEATDKFMLVYASNQPEQFDWAVNDRIDEMVPFGLPGKAERLRMLNQYMRRYLLGGCNSGESPPASGGLFSFFRSRARAIKVEGVEESHLAAAAAQTEGFSGREIAKLAIAWQSAAYGSADRVFYPALMEEVLETFVGQKRQKEYWLQRARGGGGGRPLPATAKTVAVDRGEGNGGGNGHNRRGAASSGGGRERGEVRLISGEEAARLAQDAAPA